MTPQKRAQRDDSAADELRFIIVGAGMSGILSAIKLQEAGFDNYAIYEKADRLGGTWRENEYAGIACDVPSHMYSYSFAANPEWSHRHSPGAEIQAYFEDVARRYGVESRIQYGTEITRLEFSDGRWKVETADGSTDEGHFVIAATGVLHHPSYPDIEGIDSFGGASFHTARWDHGVPLDGKRVGVIGTGSTAVQITTAVVDKVAKYSLFQRTPQWILPIQNPAYTEDEKAEFRRNPEAMQKIRDEVTRQFIDGFANILHDVDSAGLQAVHATCEANLNDSVKDPVLREKLRPNYRAACKRLVMSETFYDAIQNPAAELVTEGIERIEKAGVRTSDGRLHELDVLIIATGFQVDRFMRPMEIVGRDGKQLEEAWAEGPISYKAISIPDFPNLFMLNGPYGPVGNFSLIDVAEMQFSYIMQLIDQVKTGACSELSASLSATEAFDAERIEAAKKTIWASGCNSWYLDADGIPAAWPFTFDRFTEEMEKPNLDHFDMKWARDVGTTRAGASDRGAGTLLVGRGGSGEMQVDCDFVESGSWTGSEMAERTRWMRENDPVYWSEASGFWIITRYRDAELVSKNQEVFTSEFGIRPGTDILAGLIDDGEPRHTILRNKINGGFTPRMVKKLEVIFRQITADAIDRVAQKSECDFVESISTPLPILLIAEMIGIPKVDHQQFASWSDDLVASQGNMDDPEIVAQAAKAFVEYGRYMTELIEEKRKSPRDDLMSILVGAKDDGLLDREFINEALLDEKSVEHSALANDELIMLLVVLMIAGNETTRNGISGGMQLLIENPAERQKLIDDPSLISSAVEEMVRVVSPVRTMGRTLKRDYELGGKQMTKGQEVAIIYPSINRDADVFDEPDAFRVERNPQHLGFGIGPHFCLGANLARMEMRVTFEQVLKRLPDMAYSRGGPEFRPSSLVRSCTHMWVGYTPERG